LKPAPQSAGEKTRNLPEEKANRLEKKNSYKKFWGNVGEMKGDRTSGGKETYFKRRGRQRCF